jgi:hypothetical protein
MFVVGTVVAIRNFPSDADPDPNWWALVLVGAAGPLLTIALNGAEFVIQGRVVGARIAYPEALRVSILGTAANLLPLPGSVLVRTHALGRKVTDYRRAAWATLAVGLAWLSATAVLVSVIQLAQQRFAIGAVVAGAGVGLGAVAFTLIRRSAPPDDAAAVFGSLYAVEAMTALVGAARFYGILVALGLSVTANQAVALTLAGVIASATGIFPAGIGIREALSAAVSPLVGLPAAIGLLAAAADRVAGLIVLAILTGLLLVRGVSLSTTTG